MNKTTIIFATNNRYKIDEIQKVSGQHLNIITLADAGIDIEIPEPHDTLEENALEKSRTIHGLAAQNCFSEDTGLEVEALGGEPGVKSARYAGDGKSPQANIDKLMNKLAGVQNRSAQFRTVISLIWNDKEYFFEGVCKGWIIEEQKGTQGFGYDPVFMPDGSTKTFGEMTMDEKGVFSHRRKATDKLVEFFASNT